MSAPLPHKWIRPTVGPEQAQARLSRRSLWQRMASRLGRAFPSNANDGSTRSLPRSGAKLELVYLPCGRVTVTRRDTLHAGGRLDLLVHGHAETVEVLRGHCFEMEDVEPGQGGYSYPLSRSQTLELARRNVTMLRLGRLISGPDGMELAVEFRSIWQRPYWVYYFKRQTGRIDFRMLDAVTGRPGGHLLRQALLRALARQEKLTKHV